eukprot:m.66431 g.66431  ORF g.66431 m.66431 type:complete len:298 (+) comp35388_c0_seq2:111-1004(+)
MEVQHHNDLNQSAMDSSMTSCDDDELENSDMVTPTRSAMATQDPRLLDRMPPPQTTVITMAQQHVAAAADGTVAAAPVGEEGGTDDSEMNDVEDMTEEERQRLDLNRRPSYRRIFDELKDGVGKSDPDAIRHVVTTNAAGVIGAVPGFQAASMIHDPTGGSGGVQFQVVANSPAGAQPSVITFNSPQPQQVRVSGVGPASVSAAQFVTAGQIHRIPGLAAQVLQSPNPQQLAEDSARKREMRLMKNREAAKECRRKKKEYVKCLENRVAVLEQQNKTLIDELKALKDLYCHKSGDNS